MNTATATKLKPVNNSLELFLNQFGIELDLERILIAELELGLANELNHGF